MKIVSATNFYASTASNTTAASLLSLGEHATDDDIFICVGHDGAGTGAITMTTGTGWTEVVTQAASDDIRSTVFRKRVTSPETVPVFSANGATSEEWSGTVFVVRGLSASTPVSHWHRTDVSNTNSWNSNGGVAGSTLAAGSVAGPSAATFTDGQVLVLHAHCDQGQPLLPDLGVLTEIGKSRDAASTAHIVGFKTLNGSGTVPNVVIRGTVAGAADGGVCYALVLNPATSSDTLGCATAAVTVVAYLGDVGAIHDAITWGTAASRDATNGGTILGVATGSTAITPIISTAGDNTSSPWNAFTVWSTSANLGTAAWTGGIGTLTSVVDISGKMLAFQMSTSYLANTSPTGAEGLGVYLEDNASHWSFFQLRKSDTMPYSGELFTPMFDPSTALRSAGSGTLDLTNIKYIGFMAHRLAGSGSNRIFSVKSIIGVGKTTFIGGGTTDPATWDAAVRCLTSWSMIGPAVRHVASTDQFQIKQNSDIGDGTNAIVFSSSATSMAFPSAWDGTIASLSDYKATVGPGGKNITLVGGTGSALVLDGSLISADSDTAVEFTVSASYAGTVSASGCTLSGYTFTDSKGLSWDGLTIQKGGTATIAAGGDLTSCTIAETTSTNAALSVTANGSVLDSCTIDGTGAAYALELGTAVTAITLTDVTFTGTPATDKVHVLKTTGTVTITISGTTSLAAGDVTSDGATVVISAPQLYQEVVVSGFTAGSRIQIYDTTSSAELFNGTASAGDTVVSGSTATWTDPLAASANRAIRVRVAYVSGATADLFQELSGLTCGQTSGTESVTYPVTPSDDTVYNANGITGSGVTGVTFTDAGTDVININVVANAISWKTIYAAWVYYVFGATGIASDIDYIDAVDGANYILSNLIIKNTSSPTAPLEVTGGYGRDLTTGATIDLADTTGGTLIFAPDHVVSYAVGSGVTAQDITDIAAEVNTVLADDFAAIDASAVWTDPKALTVAKFLGLK